MFDRIFSAALAFCVLAGGTLAIGTAMLERHKPQASAIHLPRVEIDGKRGQEAAKTGQTALLQAPRTV